MMVLVLGSEGLMEHIGIDEEDTLGYSVDSSDGITYEEKCGFIAGKYLVKGGMWRWGGIRMWSMNMMSRRRMSFNLT